MEYFSGEDERIRYPLKGHFKMCSMSQMANVILRF